MKNTARWDLTLYNLVDFTTPYLFIIGFSLSCWKFRAFGLKMAANNCSDCREFQLFEPAVARIQNKITDDCSLILCWIFRHDNRGKDLGLWRWRDILFSAHSTETLGLLVWVGLVCYFLSLSLYCFLYLFSILLCLFSSFFWSLYLCSPLTVSSSLFCLSLFLSLFISLYFSVFVLLNVVP
jgi:hypothetical protein